MFTSNVLNAARNAHDKLTKRKRIEGKVVLVKDDLLGSGVNDFGSSVIDRVSEVVGQGVFLQLISSVHGDNANGFKGKIGKAAKLENWIGKLTGVIVGDTTFEVTFDWDDNVGIPGAVIVRNAHNREFFLKTITLTFENVPGHEHDSVVFDCHSWMYPKERYSYERIFFANKSYLPGDTPAPLRYYREQELAALRGQGTKKLELWDRVYDYAFYNDLGKPDSGAAHARQTLGGSSDFPYPRRGRTSRPPTKTDSTCESGLPVTDLLTLNVYVPRDERFGSVKMSDFIAYGLKFLTQGLTPALQAYFDGTEEIDSFDELFNMYDGGLKLPPQVLEMLRKSMPIELLKEIFRSDGEGFPKFPKPHVLQKDKWAWSTDEEFARETVAGVNPVVIRRLEEFPPRSNLDPAVYGDHTSTITEDHIEKHLGGHVFEALYGNKLFIVDYHDAFMPYLNRINSTDTKLYASRTLFYLQDDGTLKVLAIELSLPNPKDEKLGPVSKVYTPASTGIDGTLWKLAKAYAAVNDSGFHQLVSHWLNTHAVVEPFVIAANRHLSALHPIHKLLQPHFKDTMFINALARQTLINSGGILELTVFPGKFALEMSAVVYKNWVFTEQGLPADLIKRGVAVEDSSNPLGVRLLIEDYPFAVDGLEIWSAIKSWVDEYTLEYYKSDEAVQKDTELQAFWKELVEVGHGDLRGAPWWPKMQTRSELVESCTTLIWISSALHAAVNFGQYPYAGFLPNRPTVSRRFIPEEGTPEFEELKTNPDKAYFKTITSEMLGLLGVSLIEILSRHASDEVYLGKRENEATWTLDAAPKDSFKKFADKLSAIEAKIGNRNADKGLKNRAGPVEFPYTLLMPYSKEGITARGIPNSISI